MSVLEIAIASEEGEKEDDVLKRAKKAVEKIKSIKTEDEILIIGHNSFTAAIFCVLENSEDLVGFRKSWEMKNSEVREVEV